MTTIMKNNIFINVLICTYFLPRDNILEGHRVRIYMATGFMFSMTQSVFIPTLVCWCNCYPIQYYLIQIHVIKFVSTFWQVRGFLWMLRFPPSIKLIPRYNWNLVEGAIKHSWPITQNRSIHEAHRRTRWTHNIN